MEAEEAKMTRWFWDELEDLHDEMQNLFDYMYRGQPRRLMLRHGAENLPENRFRCAVCDMRWKDNSLQAAFELPGVDKKDIELNVADNYIEVKVDRKEKSGKEGGKAQGYYESRQQFYRRVPLPENVDSSKAKAEFKNGQLTVEIPKRKLVEQKKQKRLEIK